MSIDSVSVSSIMTKDVKTATESQTIHNICKIMCDNNIGDVIIVKQFGSEPVGIITERDIVNQMALIPSSLQIAVREFMSKPLITLSPNNTVKDAIQTMQLKDIRRLLVVDNRGKAVGIITDRAGLFTSLAMLFQFNVDITIGGSLAILFIVILCMILVKIRRSANN